MKIFCGFLAVLLLLSANEAKAKVFELSENDNGSVIQAEVGDVIRVNLHGNATTGYAWHFSVSDVEAAGKIAEGYVQDDDKLIGSGGVFEYALKILKSGKIILTAFYYRPWEGVDVDNDKKVEYIIEAGR